MLCIGSSIGVLVTGRLLQGFSAAVVWTVGLALLVDTVGQKEIGQIMGYVFLSISVAYLTAPLLGGVVYARAGYYAVFYMAFAVIAVDITLRLLLVEKKVAKRWLDEPATSPPPPSLSLTNPLSSPASGPVSEPGAENSPDINNSAITSAEKSVVPPTVPARLHRFTLPPIVTLLGSRRLLSALWCCMVQATLTTAFDSVLPLFVQSTFSWSSTGAGLIFLPLIVPSLVAPYIGFIADKYGPRYLAFAGFLFICPFLILLRLVTFDSLPQKAGLCVLLALVGFGLAVAMVPLLAEVTYVVEAKERATPGIFGERGAYAQAYALFNVFFAAGTLIGPIWGGFVVRSSGWRVMTLTLGVLAAVTAVPALVWTGGVVTRRHRGERRVGVHEGEGSGVQGEGTEKGPSDA
ncbi:hypothetical protein MMC13_005074 [Lambiella insularis]|nr:hypothetical protein [Lambiella insularis]